MERINWRPIVARPSDGLSGDKHFLGLSDMETANSEACLRISEMVDQSKHRILMVSDFFFPNFGGVESHIYYLAQCLLKLGHKVVVMTHAYEKRSGVRYMTGGLKVYYIPWKPFLMQNTLPTFYGTLPIIRTILIREKISLVHGHQAFSTLCHEALMHSRTMGYKVVFTDHSLYGFADAGSIHMNKVLQFTLADVSQAICVSHTSKENTVLRSGLPPEKVFVIPNAVDTAMFKPAPKRLSSDEIIIVVISRLVYRKGADLLVEVIPEVCRLHPNLPPATPTLRKQTKPIIFTSFYCWFGLTAHLEAHFKVRFIVGGDGPKRVRLEEMREKNSLQDRVEMLGAVPHAKVRSVLISGHIFLNRPEARQPSSSLYPSLKNGIRRDLVLGNKSPMVPTFELPFDDITMKSLIHGKWQHKYATHGSLVKKYAIF
ncbi:hypothetical protein RHMOL_Rhmol03G0071800 [Rhododendron molle]|uniref:Uncharacterized protein n=1 Tax=Rhododendron molle TaxID=49168 RepID=A0ACC0PBU9_RHOML|nr:hypothetical protein RHMOL_Rhmol03G0071800 [Rhododendron molle]